MICNIFSNNPARPSRPQALRFIPYSLPKWGASHAASEPGPGQGWWQPAGDPQGSFLLWLQLAVTRKGRIMN